jgi:hypothetical protein
MNRIRYLAGGLLCLNGLIHVTRLGFPPLDATFVTVVVVFGVAYLIIGGLLFRNNKTAYYLCAIVTLIGLCVGPVILTNPPILFAAFLGAIEIVVVVSCFYLIKGKRSL